MSKKDLKIKNLSKYRYRELKNICLQYREMKEEIKHMPYDSVRSVEISDMPTAHNTTDMTANIVIKMEKLKQRINAIEQAAIETDSIYYNDILKSVTEGIRYEYINTKLCRTEFYILRRLFFCIIDKKI